MITLLHGHDRHKFPHLFDQMYRLRAKAFKDRRGWSVDVFNGLEFDQFDDLDALYILAVNDDGELLASLRLLQTTGPHMLADVFPETLNGQPPVRHPLIWESTRFCVDTAKAAQFAPNGINFVTGQLLAALFETALSIGLEQIVSVYDLYMERILRRAGCIFDRLGPPHEYDGLPTVAGVFEVSENVISRIWAAAGITESVLPQNHKGQQRVAAVAASTIEIGISRQPN